MAYKIRQEFIKYNNPGTPLKAKGIVVHETDDPGATAQNEHDYFNSGNRMASAHAFIDWTKIIQTIPWEHISYHAGPTANHKYIGIELCHPKTHRPAKFNAVWNRATWIFAYLFVNYLKIKTVTKGNLMSHAEVSAKWHESSHQDPIPYFSEYGKTVNDFRKEVQVQINLLLKKKNRKLLTKINRYSKL